MVLLDILSKKPDIDLVVAHFNHGIRPSAAADEHFVHKTAMRLNLPYEAGCAYLGAGASEDSARRARYDFLNSVKDKHGARAIITAHHQDDLIETAFINLIRGTGRKGLITISSSQNVLRPLLRWSKTEILAYAAENQILWREDESNVNTDYLRNYVRHRLMPKLDAEKYLKTIKNIDKLAEIDAAIEPLAGILSSTLYKDMTVDRMRFSALPVAVADELLTRWMRQLGTADFDRRTISRLNTVIRTAKPSTSHPIKRNLHVYIKKNSATFHTTP